MKIFISYSVDALELVNYVSDQIQGKAETFYWDKSNVPGADAWPTIFSWIDQADLVLVLITDKTVHRALSVGQEIGHATKAGKTIIPMVGENVPVTELGCLAGVTYIPMKLSELSEATAALEKRIDQMSEERKRLETEREAARESEKKNNIIKTAGIALILYNLLKE